jgi:hypothetical protein
MKVIKITGMMIMLASMTACRDPLWKMNGKWSASGTIGDSTAPFSWYLEYTFDQSLYEKNGYPPLYEKGRLELMDEKGDTLMVRFIPEKSESDPVPYEEHVIVHPDKIIIGNKEFLKVGKK